MPDKTGNPKASATVAPAGAAPSSSPSGRMTSTAKCARPGAPVKAAAGGMRIVARGSAGDANATVSYRMS